MRTKKLAILATTALVGNFFVGAAVAQSTASAAVETIVVTGRAGPPAIEGMITAETVAKSRTTIDQDFIETQVPGQTIVQSLSVLTPGLNFTNTDPYGTSGGNIRLHGFDGNRVALTFDGMPLNDTGNYATYTNQLLDSELISKAQVNTGSTDVDSPTAASTGGTINFASRTPSDKFGGFLQASAGEFKYHRYVGFIDSGEIGPWGTKAWASASFQEYDKFKGEGELQKTQYNAKIYQPIGAGDDFLSVAFHYNENRNSAYFGPNLQTFNADGTVRTREQVLTDPSGYDFDFNRTYAPITSTPATGGLTGDVDLDPSSNSSYYGLRINPSNTGNIRGQSKFSFGDNITLTVDPSFQYTLANGGTQNILVYESCNGSTSSNTLANCPALTRQLIGNMAIAGAGVDLNGDGDLNDNVRVMNPSNTNTRRIGLLSSLIWKLNDTNLLRFGYTYDRGRHRQTGEFGFINPDHTYADNFGGKDGNGDKIETADGTSFMRNRDRFSIAELNQVSAEYRGNFLNDKLAINIGVRAPYFKRELNQYCYSQNGSSSVRCTTEVPTTTLANGNVQFAGSTTQYIAPYQRSVKYDGLLPNVGASYFFGGSQIFASYAESISLPRTDNLYTVYRDVAATTSVPFVSASVQPETSQTMEGGYRYSAGDVIATATAWATKFQNRIVSSYDQDLGISIDRNVGEVQQWGIDAALGWSPSPELSTYLSASYNDSEVQDDIRFGAGSGVTGTAPTKGKKLVETPDWTFSGRLQYEPFSFLKFGAQVKLVGERWVTDVNDLKADPYTVTDLDATYRLAQFGFDNSYIQLNVTNLFDKQYYGNLGTVTSATFGQAGFGTPFASVGAPRTVLVTVRGAF